MGTGMKGWVCGGQGGGWGLLAVAWAFALHSHTADVFWQRSLWAFAVPDPLLTDFACQTTTYVLQQAVGGAG